MTNLRDALEKAGVTPGHQAEIAADNVVDELAKMISSANSPQMEHAPLEEVRPKLVEDNSELASVVDRLEELVTGQPTADLSATATEAQDHAPPPTMVDPEPVANEMRAAAELTDDQPPTAPTVDLGSIPMLQTDQISGADQIPGTEPVAGGFSEDIQSIDDNVAYAPEDPTADNASGDNSAEFSSYDPLGIEDEISVGTDQYQPVTESSVDDAGEELEESFHAIISGDSDQDHVSDFSNEAAQVDAQALDTAQALDAAATEPEQVAQPSATDLPSEDMAPDGEGFNPQMIPGIKPGNTMSTVTTDESSISDPIAAANELTGDFLPQDLAAFDQEYASDQIEFVETDQSVVETDPSAAEPDPSHVEHGAFDTRTVTNAALATVTSAAIVPTETKTSFLQTTNLQTTQDADDVVQPQIQQPSAAPVVALAASATSAAAAATSASAAAVAAEQVAAPIQQTEVATPPPVPKSTPPVESLSTTAAGSSDKPTEFERHVLENLTKSPYATEYQQLADSILTPDLNTEPKSVCFLSAEDSSHATEVVSHLAVVFSTLKNKRVLVVDANGCPDNITRAFHKDKQPGLKNMTSVNDDWLDMALPTAVPNLFILPTGWRRGGSTHWEAGEFAGLIPLFTRQFDLTLIDGGVAERTEDTPFYAACDRTLMLVRLGQTDRNMALAVRNGLKSANVQLDGCVITNHPA